MITFTFYFWPKSLDRPLHVSLDFRGSITDTSIDLITFSQFQFDLQWQSQFLQIFDKKKAVAESKRIRMMTTNLLNKMMMIGMKEPGGSRKRHMEPPGD